MPEAVIRRCPRCGRKAHDRMLVQCPDCQVPFIIEEQNFSGLTPEQIRLVAAQIFGSWKFWACLVIIVGAGAWAVVTVADRIIDARAKAYLNTLEANATNHIGVAFGQISNQIAAEFRQPKIKAAIEQTARARASEIFTNGVRPTLDAFQDALDSITAQLARSSNAVAKLEADALAAQRRIPPPALIVPVAPTPAPVADAAPVPTATNATPTAPANVPSVRLTLINRTVTQVGANYTLTMFFRATSTTGNPPNGVVEILAGTYRQTARILSFASMTSGPTEPATVNPAADVAQLRFLVSDREAPTLVLEVSAPTIVRISSDSLDTDLTLPVAADRMPLPTAGK